jgi:hypothetical protein
MNLASGPRAPAQIGEEVVGEVRHPHREVQDGVIHVKSGPDATTTFDPPWDSMLHCLDVSRCFRSPPSSCTAREAASCSYTPLASLWMFTEPLLLLLQDPEVGREAAALIRSASADEGPD